MKRKILKLLMLLVMIAVAAVAIMALWNYVVPSVIGWSSITYMQALALLILSRILFGGFGGMKQRREMFGRGDKALMREKLKGMSREERREYIKSYMSGNEQ